MARFLRGEDVLDVTFTQTQFRVGYDEREVDDFLDRATAALRHHEAGRPAGDVQLSSSDVTGVRFTQTTMRRGYDQEEIDAFLDDLGYSLQQHEAGEGAPAEGATLSIPSAPTSGPRRHEYAGGVLREEESWGSRLLRKLRGDKI